MSIRLLMVLIALSLDHLYFLRLSFQFWSQLNLLPPPLSNSSTVTAMSSNDIQAALNTHT